jgi:cell division protein FtsW
VATRSSAIGARTRRRARSGSRVRTKLHLGHPAVLLGIVTAALVMLGLVMILSASSVQSFADNGSSFTFFRRQLIGAAIGLVGFLIFVKLDYHVLRKLGYLLLFGSFVMLVAVLIPGVGTVAGGSARWVPLGPLSFQPSEAAKLAIILFMADVFSRKKEETLEELGHTLVPILPVVGAFAALIMLQPDLGTTLLIGGISMGMLFVAGAPLRYIIPMGAVGGGLATVAALIEPYRRARVLAFLDPWSDPLRNGYQTIQGLIALGSGGWLGVGLGASRQKWMYVPNAHTDFIFAILGEEMGLVGTFIVVGMFMFLTYLGVKTAQRAPDRFGMLVASGITLWMALQALVNMGAVTASLPITGVPLPLVSFGSTSLVISLVAMGILVNIALQGRHPAPRNANRGR